MFRDEFLETILKASRKCEFYDLLNGYYTWIGQRDQYLLISRKTSVAELGS